ncbi:Fe(3+) ions import ATP-binding protein FbpC [Afipia carboxidovorans OM5]|uniref:ABC transporter ATP-binding protein, putative Fe(3+) ions import protein FbpC n=1 Tax=Afipia carboxidovorans (strain ATCC 49405 / DSM 1227 / KCTC 32145 / OM5) TaxID=504832 RepID=B6JE60_AFIC5|nr:ABC transporter ATP-binding protein [Afipia carboxidovorans]ACI93957.1 Fe(3+) ions import ATP-binding protein FbpC [Afipia carboxidovorans OM5]AEI02372.1 ABC transporter ATP-binding protein, putative Fe(3+) ions import protein FbpC [Afipia carboxidovorans OM4]AEI05948.1 ABC transporter ATP-binding protein, putative Fe(3+) ions import protein FbpC [Afipia carboxidovorans OM5]
MAESSLDALKREAAEISISNVNVSYGAYHALKNVNLEIKPGEFFAFLGPSGCGKTTLLRLIAGFNTAQTGSVVIGGRNVLTLPPWRRDVGMVFQSYALWPHMTVWKNVTFGLEERRLSAQERNQRAEDALKLVGLEKLADRKPSQLSGGQQQRVALARTIAVRPTVLLLDEPLSNLDASLRVQVRREILAMQRRLGLTTIFVTHDQEEANTVCDRIAVMSEGMVQQVGTPMELYDNPANLFVGRFLGTANTVSGEIRANGSERVFQAVGGEVLPAPANEEPGPAKLFFRPQNASLVTKSEVASGSDLRLSARISGREFLGSTIRYALKTGGEDIFIDVPHIGKRNGFSEDDVVGVQISPSDASIFR